MGYGIVRKLAEEGLTVVLTARDATKGQAAADALTADGSGTVFFHPLDVRSAESAASLASWLKEKFGGIDILVSDYSQPERQPLVSILWVVIYSMRNFAT